MKLKEYIYCQSMTIFLSISGIGLIALFLTIVNVTLPIIFCVSTFLLLLHLTIFFYEWFRRNHFFNSFFDDNFIMKYNISFPSFIEGRIIYKILDNTMKKINLQEIEEINKKEEELDYIQAWAHEIKTPLTTIKLILQNNNGFKNIIEQEIMNIENAVDQLLYFNYVNQPQSDYLLKHYNLSDIIKSSLNDLIEPLIIKNFTIEVNETPQKVIIDKKYFVFALKQIIINSIKYSDDCKKPKLIFSAETTNGILYFSITDNGIGIPLKDLPKIFERGFTGENGRNHSNSTGVGLYICKSICSKMDIGIDVKSTIGNGTTVTFAIKDPNISKM